ncbi:MAG TPA: alpha-amylase family glycosyl hydrolase [Woeseiaceae bacterium]|nr:alpha-amylase family glycosyl hydrolase [Woeseiaceae bacterium]
MKRILLSVALVLLFAGCDDAPVGAAGPGRDCDGPGCDNLPAAPGTRSYAGTHEPFASEAVYFVLTDRFVDGDPDNNQAGQGEPDRGTFDRPLLADGVEIANIGYLGGDFRGLLDHAGYIAEMGFTAVWITPVVENPDEAFTGGHPPGDIPFGDQGKTGYHGYWGVNFFEVDEHLESAGLDFASLVSALRDEHGLGLVLDIVANHGSPSWTMPEDQPMYGEIYDAEGRLVADHENLPPAELDPANPLHAFYRRQPDLAELGDTNWENPAVLDYFVAAHSRRLADGVAAFRIDTIRHMPHEFWKAFADRIRAERPGFFMFGEAFNYDATAIAPHTFPENGGVSVLDFPVKQAMEEVFANGAPYARLRDALHLDDGVYENPYDLMTFYDNHDMPRMAADENGFIDAHNWLFTARGIPVVYYGSEIAFRAGRAEHKGNRDYFGPDNIERAKTHRIRESLARIANLRKESVALQRGLQLDMDYTERTAAFFRVYAHDGTSEVALVLLNAGDAPREIGVERMPAAGTWRMAGGEAVDVPATDSLFALTVPAHGVQVLFFDGAVTDAALTARLDELAAAGNR